MAYFPNGTSAEGFYNECAGCPLGEQPCPIALVQGSFNYEAADNDVATRILALLVEDSGKCGMRPLVDDLVRDIEEEHGVDPVTTWREEQIAALNAGKEQA